MDELEELRLRKLQELQERLALEEELRRKAILAAQIKKILKAALTKEAYERLNNIKLANPELYSQLVALIIRLYQAGRIPRPLTEEELKTLAKKLVGRKREPKIKFLRK